MTKKEMKEAKKPHPTACCEKCGGRIPKGKVEFLIGEGKPIVCLTCAQAIENNEKRESAPRFIRRGAVELQQDLPDYQCLVQKLLSA